MTYEKTILFLIRMFQISIVFAQTNNWGQWNASSF